MSSEESIQMHVLNSINLKHSIRIPGQLIDRTQKLMTYVPKLITLWRQQNSSDLVLHWRPVSRWLEFYIGIFHIVACIQESNSLICE